MYSSPTVQKDDVMINKVSVNGEINIGYTGALITNANYVYLGGIIGECRGRGSIRDAQVSGGLNISASYTIYSFNTYFICGGIIGKMMDGNMLFCEFSGKINLFNYTMGRQTFIGGLAGTIGGIYVDESIDGRGGAPIRIENSVAGGYLDITNNGMGKVTIGGICATVCGNGGSNEIYFINCEFRDGSIKFIRNNVDGGQNIGGFMGDVIKDVHLTNCSTRAGSITVTTSDNTDPSGCTVGGFAGVYRADASGCFSKSHINVTFTGSTGTAEWTNLRVGGFAGDIDFC